MARCRRWRPRPSSWQIAAAPTGFSQLMVTTRRRRRKASPPAAQAAGGWQSLHSDLLGCCLSALLAQADQRHGLLVCRSWATVLSTCRAWRALALQVRGGPPASLGSAGVMGGRGPCHRAAGSPAAPALGPLGSGHPAAHRPTSPACRLPALQMPIDAVCPPSPALIAWLRRVRVRRLEFVQRPSERGDALCAQGFASSEQRYRASIATLLATLDFITHSAGCLRCALPLLPPVAFPAHTPPPLAGQIPASTHLGLLSLSLDMKGTTTSSRSQHPPGVFACRLPLPAGSWRGCTHERASWCSRPSRPWSASR